MTFLLPDVNVWVALNWNRHVHHPQAEAWYGSIPNDSRIHFCRQTQLGLFRILATSAVMENEALTQRECWHIFDRWMGTGQVLWADEPPGLDAVLRNLTSSSQISPKTWSDAYLAAFADMASLTLVTLDKALAGRVKSALLLE